MAEKISEYEFDFEQEVEALRQDLGSKADNIVFVETVSTPDKPLAAREVKVSNLIAGKNISAADTARMREISTWYPTKPSWQISFDEVNANAARKNQPPIFGSKGGQSIILDANDPYYDLFGKDYKDLSRLWGLYHEAGHMLAGDQPTVDNDHPHEECAADAYFALRMLQRFGDDALPFLTMISWMRATAAFNTGYTNHLTTTVLDKIVADSRTGSLDYASLSPEDTISTARDYAKHWTPEPHMLASVREFRARWREAGAKTLRIDLLSATCLSSASNPLAIYVGAKIAQTDLNPEDLYVGGKLHELTPTLRDNLEGAVRSNISGMTLRDTLGRPNLLGGSFNTSALPPSSNPSMAEALPVSPLPGQNKFIYKP